MKKFTIVLVIIFFSCQTPTEPVGVQTTYEVHYDTIDVCRGIDVSDGVLVAGASSNGYLRYDILNQNTNPTLELVNHIPDINNSAGDDAAYDVLITNNVASMAFILDDVDNILFEQFSQSFGLTPVETCGSASPVYRSMAINDDHAGEIILFTLQKYFNLEDVDSDFDLNSTFISFRSIFGTESYGDIYIDQEDCINVLNLNLEAMQINYADNLLTVTDGGLGVYIYRYNHNNADNPIEFLSNFYLQGGEAESLFSKGNYVIGGFSNDRGCYMALLDSNGVIIDNLSFAEGYSINEISYDSGTLALAAGNDGILVYDWDESMGINYKGILDVGDDNYVYDLKVDGDNIYVASENGISIYKIGN